MAEIQNVEITKVYEGKSGEGEYGPWTAYNFYVKGDDRKFSWFKTDKKPLTPAKGMSILLMEFEQVQRGEYTNYDVKTIRLKQAKQSTKQPLVAEKTGFLAYDTYYLGYSARFMSALIQNGSGWQEADPETVADIVVDMAKRMYDRAHGVDTATQEAEKGFVEPDEEGPPEDMFPPSDSYGDERIPDGDNW